MRTRLRSAEQYYRRAAAVARKAVIEARGVRTKGTSAVATVLATHQMAEVDLTRLAVGAMLDEQHIVAEAEAILNSAAFVTRVDELERMLEPVEADWEFDRLIGSLTQTAGRDAMALEVAVRPDLAWVRHVNPPCCSRCAILAGRVYRWSDGFGRHPGCDCVHVPTTVPAAAGLTLNPDELVEQGLVTGLSKADLAALADGADLNQVVNVRRTAAGLSDGREVLVRNGRLTPAGILNEAGDDRSRVPELLETNGYGRRTTAANQATGQPPEDPPRPPAAPSPTGEPDPPDDDLAAWLRRQDAIGLNFKGDVLKPWEVRSVERLVRRGESIDWIADDHSTSTPDFHWLSREIRNVEMKSTKARIETIRTRILDAASSAMRNHDVVKDTFLIDIGHERLTDELRTELQGYNFDAQGQPRRKYRLARLWVMSGDGAELDEIRLRK